MTISRSYAFLIAYLLGVEEKVLVRDYKEEYEASHGLEYFKYVPNAEILRALSRCKQSFLRNHHIFHGVINMEPVIQGRLDREVGFLKENGIDLPAVMRREGDIYAVINHITSHINRILPGVLEHLKIPYRQELESLFYLYTVDRKAVQRLMDGLRDKKSMLPHGIIIVKTSRVQRELPYTLLNDRNLYQTIFKMRGIIKSYADLDIPPFSWSNIELVNAGKMEASPSREEVKVENNPWDIISEGSRLYVDCDNIDVFVFMNTLDLMLQSGKIHEIKLYLDEMSSPLWRIVPRIFKDVKFSLHNMKRIKSDKSVVDVAMVSHITMDMMYQDPFSIGIFSSDSDFFGLFELYPDMTYFVGYSGSRVNKDYRDYLDARGIVSFDLEKMSALSNNADYKFLMVVHLCLEHLANTPMTEWSVEKLVEWFDRDVVRNIHYNFVLDHNYFQGVINKLVSDLRVERMDDKWSLCALGVDYQID